MHWGQFGENIQCLLIEFLRAMGTYGKIFKKERDMPRSVLYIEGQPSEGMKKEKKLGRKDKLSACSRKKADSKAG